jgi:hypothetical protein
MAGLLTPNNQTGMQVQQDLNDYINQLKFRLDNTTDPTLRQVYAVELEQLLGNPATLEATPLPEGMMEGAIQENPQTVTPSTIQQLLRMLGIR